MIHNKQLKGRPTNENLEHHERIKIYIKKSNVKSSVKNYYVLNNVDFSENMKFFLFRKSQYNSH